MGESQEDSDNLVSQPHQPVDVETSWAVAISVVCLLWAGFIGLASFGCFGWSNELRGGIAFLLAGISTVVGVLSILIKPGKRFAAFWLSLLSIWLSASAAYIGLSTIQMSKGLEIASLVIFVGSLMILTPPYFSWAFPRLAARKQSGDDQGRAS